jgi:glycosyltransferase involved in cell wall biosynthesis
MGKISVIIPVYNTEKYLYRCIDSVIKQTHKNLEIILVDDGSTDNSGKICDWYKNKDSRIRVIHKKNAGQSSARNIGIELATGDYIVFVDSDDWIAENIYEHCIELAETKKCDIVDFKVVFTSDETKKFEPKTVYTTELIEGKEILRNYLLKGQTEVAPFSPCRKLYKRSLFQTIRFPEGKINEDIATNYRILMNCRKLVVTNKIGYYYFQNSASTTRNGLRKRDFNLLDVCEELQILTKNENYTDIKYLVEVKYARSYFSLLAKVAFYGIDDKELNMKEVISKLTKKLRQNYFLLMNSPMPLNRKLMVTALCINIKCLSIPLYIYKWVSKEVKK